MMFIERSFTLNISHSQVAVFDASMERPFNFWTDKHVVQGFAWRPGSVSFSTIKEGGAHNIGVLLAPSRVDISPFAIRVIEVPFRVPPDGNIEIASISDSYQLRLPSSLYLLRFECLNEKSKPALKFVFVEVDNPKFKIVRSDFELVEPYELLLTASPA